VLIALTLDHRAAVVDIVDTGVSTGSRITVRLCETPETDAAAARIARRRMYRQTSIGKVVGLAGGPTRPPRHHRPNVDRGRDRLQAAETRDVDA